LEKEKAPTLTDYHLSLLKANDMKRIILIALTLKFVISASAQLIYHEHFDFVEGLIGESDYEWRFLNVSNPLGTVSEESWYQADLSMGITAYMGEHQYSYIQADRFSTSATTGGTISNWLIAPMVILSDGDSVRFHAISHDNAARPDKIEVRISPLGSNTVYPTSANDIGSFNILIGVINPDLTTSGFPAVTNDQTWTSYRFPVAGINFGNECRVALRYSVPNAGSQGPNGSAIGIDEFYMVGPQGYVSVDEIKTNKTIQAFPNPTADNVRINYNLSDLQIIDINGRVVFYQGIATNQTILNISSLSAGIYILKGKCEDESIVYTKLIKQ